jgi:hypothetical protein
MADETNTVLMLGLLGVGAYFLYQAFVAPKVAVATVPAPVAATPGTTPMMTQSQTPTSVSTVPTTTPATTPAAVGQSMHTQLQMQAQMLADGHDPAGNHTVAEWNSYYMKVTGYAPGAGAILPNTPANQAIPFATWWAAMQSAGFSGMGYWRSGGMGLITGSNFYVPQVNLSGSMASFYLPAAIPGRL